MTGTAGVEVPCERGCRPGLADGCNLRHSHGACGLCLCPQTAMRLSGSALEVDEGLIGMIVRVLPRKGNAGGCPAALPPSSRSPRHAAPHLLLVDVEPIHRDQPDDASVLVYGLAIDLHLFFAHHFQQGIARLGAEVLVFFRRVDIGQADFHFAGRAGNLRCHAPAAP